jgi:hypothetical protein
MPEEGADTSWGGALASDLELVSSVSVLAGFEITNTGHGSAIPTVNQRGRVIRVRWSVAPGARYETLRVGRRA